MECNTKMQKYAFAYTVQAATMKHPKNKNYNDENSQNTNGDINGC